MRRRGSILVMVLWVIAVLSVMVLSFSFEARQQANINVYVRVRNHVNRLIEPGRILGEIVLLGFKDVSEWSEDEDEKDLFEKDRWYKEKRRLKSDSCCTIGPIVLDERTEDDGGDPSTVTVEIELANSGSENGININELYRGGDDNYALRWQMILLNAGIDEELMVDVPDADGSGTSRHNLMNLLIASWNDWRDDDDDVSRGPIDDNEPKDDDGAESKWYEELNEAEERAAHGKDERNALAEDRRGPRNGSIPTIEELSYVRGFRDFPAVLTGGLLYSKLLPDEKESEDNPRLSGISRIFGTSGSAKVVINPRTTVEQLLTVPGIFQDESSNLADNRADGEELANAILEALRIKPDDYDVEEDRDWWPFKDWNDLKNRIEDLTTVKIDDEANQYIEWNPDEKSVFKMKITAESRGMKREVNCKCYIKDKKVRYLEWRED